MPIKWVLHIIYNCVTLATRIQSNYSYWRGVFYSIIKRLLIRLHDCFSYGTTITQIGNIPDKAILIYITCIRDHWDFLKHVNDKMTQLFAFFFKNVLITILYCRKFDLSDIHCVCEHNKASLGCRLDFWWTHCPRQDKSSLAPSITIEEWPVVPVNGSL